MKQYFIPADYKERLNNAQYSDIGMKNEWQRETYLIASSIYFKNNYNSVLDIGCGSGYKLVTNFPATSKITGIEQKETIDWLKIKYPNNYNWIEYKDDLIVDHHDLLICSDVIEHIPDAIKFMDWLFSISWDIAVISTPDRETLYGEGHRGEPPNAAHVREWTVSEFNSFLSQWGNVSNHVISNIGQGTQTAIITKKNSL